MIERSLASACNGTGQLVIVSGHAGVGKTALLSYAARRASDAGMEVKEARGSELAREDGFGVALQLFEAHLMRASPEERGELLKGAARRVTPLFGEGPLGKRGTDCALLHGLFWLTANLAEQSGLVISIDDGQWADVASFRFLLYLAQRIEELPVVVLLAHRPGGDVARQDLLTRLATEPYAQELRPARLSVDAVDQLVRVRISHADESFTRACHHATRGNPFLLRELLAAVQSRGLEPTAETAKQIAALAPDSVVRWALVRLRALPPGSLALTRAVAVLGHDADPRLAGALAELEPEAAVEVWDALFMTEVLQSGARLGFVHPLLRSAVYSEIPEARRGQMHLKAARILADEGSSQRDVAAHLLASPRQGAVWTVECLLKVARAATATGAPGSAATYLERALDEPPPSELRAQVLITLAEAEALAGRPTATCRLEQALALTEERQRKAEILLRLGRMFHREGRLSQAAAVFDRGLNELSDTDQGLADELTAGFVAAALLDPARAHKARVRVREIVAYRCSARTPAERELLSCVMLARLFRGDGFESVVALVDRVLSQPAPVGSGGDEDMSMWHAVICLSCCDELERAERVCSHVLRGARHRGAVVTMAEALCARASPRHWMGRISQATADARAAMDAWGGGFGNYLPIAAYWLALGHIERDELEQAAIALRLPPTEQTWADNPLYSLVLAGRGRLAIARGDFEAALEPLLAAGEILRPITCNPAVLPWRSDASAAAARLGDIDQAQRLAEEELRFARRFGASRPIAVALCAVSRVSDREIEIELLREALATLDRSPARLEAARTLVQLGSALRRAGHRLEAREILRQGLELADRFGALALERQARDELLAAGARPRRRALRGPDSLTPSERRVAELAARGLTNRQIAEALFVTRKAVRFHLGNAYKKLNVGSREELPVALEAADAQTTTKVRTY